MNWSILRNIETILQSEFETGIKVDDYAVRWSWIERIILS